MLGSVILCQHTSDPKTHIPLPLAGNLTPKSKTVKRIKLCSYKTLFETEIMMPDPPMFIN